VSDRIPALLARSRTELDASRVLASAGFIDQAISRAYYGAFYAAEAALTSLGETRSKHSGVVAAFGRLVVQEGGFDEKLGGEAFVAMARNAANPAEYFRLPDNQTVTMSWRIQL
jgi:uncharacterized protein (UPF0332 family)